MRHTTRHPIFDQLSPVAALWRWAEDATCAGLRQRHAYARMT